MSTASCARSTMPIPLKIRREILLRERFKSTALSGHLNSKTQSEVVQLEQTKRGSIFQREISNRKVAETKTTECVMHNLHFLMKEESTHLNELVALQGSNEIQYF